VERPFAEITAGSGRLFDPDVVDALLFVEPVVVPNLIGPNDSEL
jgi:response regulator RpfG family c-di-GMP phosphodiesterase